MQKTVRLFDESSSIKAFDATVLSCERCDGGNFAVILDKTAFFPNEGGQACDKGLLGGLEVISVDEESGVITHTVSGELSVGESVRGEIEFAERFRKMQNHTAEHIVSGIIHSLFGFANVGFHLGDGYMTADFDGELSADDVRRVETLANKAIFECRAVRAYYPSCEELASLEYRSKLELSEGVRVVEIEGVDKCACCAPHVENTGEVGLLKIVEAIRYKGGMRLTMMAGYDALEDYRERCAQIRRVSMAISSPQGEIAEGVERLLEDISALKGQISRLKRERLERLLSSLEESEGSICVFEELEDMTALRNFVNEAVNKTGRVCAVFSGDDESGYKYIMASNSVDLRAKSRDINTVLCGKGGGSSVMIQGSCTAKREEIERYILGM